MQIANVDYFYKYCNHKLGTGYTDTRKNIINIEWLCAAARKVFIDIHQPKSGCTRLIATKLRANTNRVIADTAVVKTVVDYLYNFKTVP